MQARLCTIVYKFGRDPAICLVEEAICAKCLQTDAARSPKLIPWNELKTEMVDYTLTDSHYRVF